MCQVVRILPHTKSANTACKKRSWWWTGEVRNMSSKHKCWINSLIKTLCVSCWTAYIFSWLLVFRVVITIYCDNHMEKVKLSLYTSWRHIEWVDVWLHLSVTSALDRGEQSTSCVGCFTWGCNPVTHWVGGWLGPWAALGDLEKRKVICPCRDLNPRPSSL